MIRLLDASPKGLSRSRAVGLAAVLAIFLGLVDYLTGPFVSLTVFYLFPVALAAWYAGRRQAILMSLFCAVIWTAADFETFRTHPPLALDLWNGSVRLAFFFIVSYTLTTAKKAIDGESDLAREIQQALLPASIPDVEGIDVAAIYRPAKALSGDYFDILPIEDDGLVLCIGDVAGKGAGPALLMANLQAAVRILVPTCGSPGRLCERLNDLVGLRSLSSSFITFFMCRIDLKTMTLVYSNAGHNPPLVLRRDGSRISLTEGGLVLGIRMPQAYLEGAVTLMPGDTLILYTDGLTEARDRSGREFGETRVIEALTRNGGSAAGGLQDELIGSVQSFHHGAFEDDVTVVLLSVKDESPFAATADTVSSDTRLRSVG